MTTIFFVRHGAINRLAHESDRPLTAQGIAQASATAAWLAGQRISAIYASPLPRAMQTATIIADPHGLPVIPDVRLRERANYGDLPGQTIDAFIAMWARSNVARTWTPPVGDSSAACGARVEAFVADCHANQSGRTIVAATHGGTIADFLRNVFTLDAIAAVNPALAENPYSGDIMRECSITVVRYDGQRHVLEEAANVDHL